MELSYCVCNNLVGYGGCLTLVPIVSPLGCCLCAVGLWLPEGLRDSRAEGARLPPLHHSLWLCSVAVG